MDHVGPSLQGVEQLLARAVAKIADGFLRDAILEVRVDSAEGKSLPLLFAGRLEGVISKSAIVGMVVADFDPHFACGPLERSLGGDSLVLGGDSVCQISVSVCQLVFKCFIEAWVDGF